MERDNLGKEREPVWGEITLQRRENLIGEGYSEWREITSMRR